VASIAGNGPVVKEILQSSCILCDYVSQVCWLVSFSHRSSLPSAVVVAPLEDHLDALRLHCAGDVADYVADDVALVEKRIDALCQVLR
jgi:hypothetical protein